VTDLLDSLQAALGSAYRVERELGGGGMSRVFVATETALGRRVVIKLLSPELGAGISADRFRREIQLAARLQHPHIVPLLAAGEVKLEGSNTPLLYFTMPFVEGRSLRARLANGPLTSAEAMRVLREVADALDYAHRQNVVHRDIKPDNILLSNGHAVVTDFGVAKALSTATSMDVNTTATSVGTVIGTPAYMAPEQGAGDPDVGPTADIYALGVTGFEMLTGQTPFKGATPRAILAAQLTSEAPPLDGLRQDLSPSLPPLMSRLLAKDPGSRPSAATLVGLLDQVGTPAPGTLVTPPLPARTRRMSGLQKGVIAVGVLAATLVGLSSTGLLPARTLVAEGKFRSRDRVVLADVDVPGDSALGSALTEALRVDLSQSDVLQLLSASQVRSTLRLMQQPEERALSATFAREVAVRSGAKGVIAGRIERVGGQMIVTLRLVSPETGDDLAAFRETAKDSTQLLGALDAVTKQMRRRIGESLAKVRGSQPMEAVTTSSLMALQKYSQAIGASDRGDFPQAQSLLEEALAIDSGFAMAWRKLGVAYSNQGNVEAAKKPLTRAFQFRDRLPDRERYLAIGSYYSTVGLDNDKAVAAWRAVLDIDSLDPVAANNLAVALQAQGDSAAAIAYYARSLTARDSSVVAYTNLILAFVFAGQLDSAVALQRLASARFPGSPRLAVPAAFIAYAQGNFAESERIVRTMTGAGTPPEIRRTALSGAQTIDGVQGRLKRAADDARTLAEMEVTPGQASWYYNAFGELAVMDAVYRNDPLRGKRLLDSVLAARPLAGFPAEERPYLALAWSYAMLGDVSRARALMAESAATVDSTKARALQPFRTFLLGTIAMAEKRPADALREYQKVDTRLVSCRSCLAAAMGRAFDAAGQPDSAIAWSERYLAAAEENRGYEDEFSLAPTYRRLGELHEEKGNREKAASYYQKFIDLWRDADADLQPQVTEVKKKLAHVVGEK
jgi:serine/threonine-protein kinase